MRSAFFECQNWNDCIVTFQSILYLFEMYKIFLQSMRVAFAKILKMYFPEAELLREGFNKKHRKNCECCPLSLLILGNNDCHELRFSTV